MFKDFTGLVFIAIAATCKEIKTQELLFLYCPLYESGIIEMLLT
jgi:hypothetical protein